MTRSIPFSPDLSRRGVLASGLALALAGCGGGGGPRDGGVLRVGSQKGGTKAMMLASRALDGAEYRVEWSEFPAAQNLLEALGSGAVDVGMVGDGPFAFAYQSGQPIVAISARRVQNRPEGALGIVVPGSSPLRTVQDLKGRALATTRGSIGHYLALRALSAAGLAPDAVRFVFLGPSDAAAALRSGSVAAWATWAPYTILAVAGGARVLVDARDLMVVTGYDAANVRAVTEKRALLVDFLKREAVALQWAHGHPGDYAQMLARETGMPLAITKEVAAKNAFLPVPLDAGVEQDLQQVFDTYAAGGALVARRPLADAFVPLDKS